MVTQTLQVPPALVSGTLHSNSSPLLKTTVTVSPSNKPNQSIPAPGTGMPKLSAHGKNSTYQDMAKASLLGKKPELPSLGGMAAMGVEGVTDVFDGSVSTLHINDIDVYEHNPRTKPNPLYEEIKNSIRVKGILNHISVTKRPGSQRYTVYGGGNTRLRIARELFNEERDNRFANLTVIIKRWAGEANTIGAHLAENDLRGNIGFWEKAEGVKNFRRMYAEENGKTPSTSELHRILKNEHGLAYGLRMLQNFLFAVENLAPLGPWLRARSVNQDLRPAVLSLTDIGERFDKGADVRKALNEVFQRHAAQLSSNAQESELEFEGDDVSGSEKQSPLNEKKVVEDGFSAAASVLGFSVEKLHAMLHAVESDSRISVDALLNAQTTIPQEVTTTETPGLEGHQVSTLPETEFSTSGKAVSPPSEKPPVQPRQGSTVDGTTAKLPAVTAPAPDRTKTASLHAAAPVLASGTEQQQLVSLDDLQATLQEIHKKVVMSDFLCMTEAPLPFGIFVDFPAEGFDHAHGNRLDTETAELRSALWHLLVASTGQLDRRLTTQLAFTVGEKGEQTDVMWRSQFEHGQKCFEEAAEQCLGGPINDGFTNALHLLLTHHSVRTLVVQLLNQMDQIRTLSPDLELVGFEPLFSRTRLAEF